MEWEQMLENAFYLLALLNPASKIMFLATCDPPFSKRQIWELSWKSSAAALLILILLCSAGQFLLSKIFRVELYSLQITGGLIVFLIGWTAVSQGRFVNKDLQQSGTGMTDLSLVPLAAPLIAGPGMIAAVIAAGVEYGFFSTILSMTIAIFINFVLMLFSERINLFLTRTHLLGPLIRLTGLVIAAVAMQMIIGGLQTALRLK